MGRIGGLMGFLGVALINGGRIGVFEGFMGVCGGFMGVFEGIRAYGARSA